MAITISGTTGIAGVDGSAGTPAVQGTDTNTGVFYPAADTVGVSTGGSERMRVDSSGNVGIGTSSPSYKLQVSGATSTDANTDLTGAQFVANGIAFRQKGNSAGISGVTFAKQIYASGSPDVMEIYNASNYALVFGTNATERMRIDSSGNLLVGTTSTIGSATGVLQVKGVASQNAMQLQIGTNGNNGILFYNASASAIGSIVVNSGSVAYNTTSDYRLKENIAPMTGALEKVSALKPVTYTWKATGESTQGFIAHELQEVCPDAVSGEKDAVDADGNPVYQGIDTSFLVATLTAAIQEQQALITALTARIEALEAK